MHEGQHPSEAQRIGLITDFLGGDLETKVFFNSPPHTSHSSLSSDVTPLELNTESLSTCPILEGFGWREGDKASAAGGCPLSVIPGADNGLN